MKYFILTLGCQQNVHDSLRLETLLNKLGYAQVSEKEADSVFILACSVRASAANRIFGNLKNWSGKKLYVTACVLPNDQKKLEEKGLEFFSIDDLNSLKDLLGLKIGGDLNLLADSQKESAYLPIMTGCDNFCSYCAVPYTRGREKSRPTLDIVNDFQRLLKSGHTEITLLGQNVNSFSSPKENEFILNPKGDTSGQVEGSSINFPGLLKTLNDLSGDFAIKFMSNHPKDMSDELIEVVASLPKVSKEIHLPLQSGSTRILKEMNRRYTKEDYLQLVQSLRSKVPKVKISTDIIVGFPGETKQDFEDTVDVVKKSKFQIAFIAKYSPRPGTASAKLKDDVPQETKKERFRMLDQLINHRSS